MSSLATAALSTYLPFGLLQAVPPAADRAADRASDGLTLPEVVAALPTDPASLVALALVAVFFGAIVWFGTRKPPVKPTGT